jgi:hypothetical protein
MMRSAIPGPEQLCSECMAVRQVMMEDVEKRVAQLRKDADRAQP